MSYLLPLLHEKLIYEGFSYLNNLELKEDSRFDYYEIRLEKLFKDQVIIDKLKKNFFSLEVVKTGFESPTQVSSFKLGLSFCLGESHPQLGQMIGTVIYNFTTQDQFFSDWESIHKTAHKLYDAIAVLEIKK